MICVLNVVEGPVSGMCRWLRHDQTLQVGRIATADFSIADDLQMSRNHFVVEGCGDSFRVRDVGSSNGTFVNDARVKVMDLCSGDKIRAGSTIFVVSFQADGQVIPVSPLPKSVPEVREPGIEEVTHLTPAGQKAPTRTVDMSNVGLDSESEEVAATQIAIPDTAGVGGGGGRSESGDEGIDIPLLSPDIAVKPNERVIGGSDSFHGQWWKSYFAPTDQPGLYLDTFSRTKGQKHSVPDLLGLAEPTCDLVLVVNSGQLSTSTRSMLDFAVAQGGARPISETLFMLTNQSSIGVRQFLDRCAHQDAAICFGLEKNSASGYRWIENAVEFLSYPSMFYSIVRDEQSQLLPQVLKKVTFAVFEKNPAGSWCLLMTTS